MGINKSRQRGQRSESGHVIPRSAQEMTVTPSVQQRTYTRHSPYSVWQYSVSLKSAVWSLLNGRGRFYLAVKYKITLKKIISSKHGVGKNALNVPVKSLVPLMTTETLLFICLWTVE